jgi:thiamine biosynthesis lipoprotein
MNVFHLRFEAMGGVGEVVLGADNLKHAQEVAASAIDEVSRIERKYSRYRPESILSQINESAGKKPVECDEETDALFGYVDSLYENSDGLFDITSGILRKAWDFSQAVVPERETLDALIEKIGWDKVERHGRSVRLPIQGMQLDFGGFAKEYAADRAAANLHAKGMRSGYVNLAGDIRVIGPKPDGSPWLVGIRDPRDSSRMLASLLLHTGALATSGDYERYFEIDGRRYCHILHPRTGMPVTNWRSVSVLAPLAVHAGSCTTIAMLKEPGALPFLERSCSAFLAVDRLGVMYHRNCDIEYSP